MFCPPLPPARLVQDWVERHRYPPSLACHLVGIPVSVLGLLLFPVALPLFSWRILALSIGLFVAGYGFQFLGHLLEWTEPGEITALKEVWARRGSNARPSGNPPDGPSY